MTAPSAPEQPHRLSAHGHERVDPWYWLREREDPRVLAHLKAENAHTEAALAPVAVLRAEVLAELKARIKPDDSSLPFRIGAFLYYRRFEAGKEYPVFARKPAGGGAEEILLDVNELAQGHAFADVPFPEISPDAKRILYAVDLSGDRLYELRVKDLGTGVTLATITGTTGNAEWAADSATFFYGMPEEGTLRARAVHRRDPDGTDTLVYDEADETFDVGIGKSRTGKFLFLASGSTLSSEWHVIDAASPREAPRLFLAREEEHEYSLEDGGDAFYVLSNWEARNFRLLKAPHAGAPKAEWGEVVAHRPDVLLEGADFFASHYVLSERFEGLTRLAVVDRASGARREIAMPDAAGVAGIDVNAEFAVPCVRYRFESLVSPPSILEASFADGSSALRKRVEIPTYDPGCYRTERLWAAARDGERVPVSLVYRAGFRRDGTAPLLVYGYGAYGMSLEPWFQPEIASLLDRGFVYAIAHVRGGSELGRRWYEAGRLEHKENSFRDFLDVTEHLLREKYGDPARTFAQGASAGGLLVGAAANLQPELFRGVHAGVPFVDVLSTMLDDSLPLTTGEYDEWGDPNEEDAYRRMASYSPYDNVRAATYPAFLVTVGWQDTLVPYWEGAKWALKLRRLSTSGAPVLVHADLGAGHGGASGRYQAQEQTALEHAFFLGLANGSLPAGG